MNTLGLGTRSTILNGLYNAGVIASRSFSIYFGLTGADKEHQMDGNLVLGGYDAAKFTGQNYTSTLTPQSGCDNGLLTFVSDILMDFPNGTSQSIIGQASGSALKMCSEPNYELITVPLDIWQLFQQYAPGTYIGRSLGINLWGEVYAAENV
jgi:Eukaryotic aspartyl protease